MLAEPFGTCSPLTGMERQTYRVRKQAAFSVTHLVPGNTGCLFASAQSQHYADHYSDEQARCPERFVWPFPYFSSTDRLEIRMDKRSTEGVAGEWRKQGFSGQGVCRSSTGAASRGAIGRRCLKLASMCAGAQTAILA